MNLMAGGLGLIISYIFMPQLKEMLSQTNLMSKNYLGETIPNSMGIGIVFAQVLSLGSLSIFSRWDLALVDTYLIGFIFIGFLGLLDDTIGTDQYKGFKGHIGAFFKGQLTTGNIKASLGLFISLYVGSKLAVNIWELLLDTVLIALFTNLMNLFDLRPGRAIKVFFILVLASLIFLSKSGINYILLSLVGILLVYFLMDIRAQAMMGDSGSNVLGYSLGFYLAYNLDLGPKLLVIILLVITNLISEKTSFSKIIEGNKLLNYIDRLGR